jgi:hypothetical protein
MSRFVSLILLGLLAEKVIQHVFVTVAFLFDIGGSRSSVALDYRFFMVAGGVVSILYVIALWAVYSKRKYGLSLVVALAVLDILGEFIAQSRFDINLNFSFIGASILLILAKLIRRNYLNVCSKPQGHSPFLKE